MDKFSIDNEISDLDLKIKEYARKKLYEEEINKSDALKLLVSAAIEHAQTYKVGNQWRVKINPDGNAFEKLLYAVDQIEK